MERKTRNILFIMCDQLRYDYLSCYGHPHLHTPNIDWLASRGVMFTQAYVQAPLCGPSRASFYTGRYVSTHGASWNGFPLRVDEWTLGDYLRPFGVRTALVGKTHMELDLDGLSRLGITRNSAVGQRIAEAGFEPFERDDGQHPDPLVTPDLRYNAYLRSHGYQSENGWDRVANGARGDDWESTTGWLMRNAKKPAVVADEHSETAYMTDRAMEFIAGAGDQPWCLHLSYIKPHWPYIAPAPYHAMYSVKDMIPACRSRSELENPHPVYEAFTKVQYSEAFSRDEVRDTVVPVYMGLVKQIDDHIGRLLAYLAETGRINDTMIVFTSDHGDYLGDHWLGEKDLFHEQSIRIPLIVYDPSAEADCTRGTTNNRLVEAIDLVPTFYQVYSSARPPYRIEGRSLLPLLRNQEVEWRDAAFCEIDFSCRQGVRQQLGLKPAQCRGYMVRRKNWKYILYEGYPPQLFDLETDPEEFIDLGRHPEYEPVRQELHERLFYWIRARHTRTVSEEFLESLPEDFLEKSGILIGHW